MGAYRKSTISEYSDVDKRHTPISDEDRAILVNGSKGYFQSWNSFIINKAIRRSQKERIPLESALVQQYEEEGFHTDDAERRKDQALKVIESMDRSMKPLDKDVDVVRMTTNKWLRTALQKMGVYTDDLKSVATDYLHNIVRTRIDKINETLANNDVIYYDQAFNSATYNTSLSDSAFSDRPVRIEYVGTKGTNAVFSPTDSESEVVFDRKSGLQIERIGWDSDKYQLVIYGRTTKK